MSPEAGSHPYIVRAYNTFVQGTRITNRQALLEAALASLQDKGYADTTAREVANRAGVSLGAIGYHFGSMQQLLDAALAEGVRRWFKPLIRQLTGPQALPPIEQLGPSLDRWVQTLSRNRPLVIAYFEALLRAERSPSVQTMLAADFQELRTALTTAINQLLARHQPEPVSPDPQAAASLIMATFDGLIIQWLLDPQRVPDGQLITDTIQHAATLLSTNPATAASP